MPKNLLKLYATRLILAAAIAVCSGYAQQLQSFKDCVVGKRVSTNRDGRKGTITHLDNAWSYCYVRFDDNGKEESLLYSLLNSEDGLAAKDLILRVGMYECVIGGNNAGWMRISSPTAYSVENLAGKYLSVARSLPFSEISNL